MLRSFRSFAAVLLLVGTSASAAPATDRTATERLHATGVTILEGDGAAPSALPEALAATLDKAMRLSEANAEDFGYPFADRARGTVVVVPVTFRGDLLTQRLSLGLANVTPLDVNQWTAAGRHTRRYLETVMDGVIGVQPEGLVVRAAYPDPERDRIVVEVTKLDDDFLYRAAATWDPTALAVRVVDDFGGSPSARNNDTSSFWGGAVVNGCTTGFSWNSGSTRFMLTAGHCFPTGGSAATPAQFMGSVRTDGSEESWNNGTGTVLMTGQTTLRGDVALIRITSGASSTGIIYSGAAGASSSRLVREMWSRSPASGDQYCTGGAVSGEQCGWVVQWSAAGNYTYDGGTVARRVWRGDKRGWCMIGGDSGGPVYTVRSDGGVAAKGIISGAGGFGGSDAYAGALDTPCRNIFTDIWDAWYGLPGSLTLY